MPESEFPGMHGRTGAAWPETCRRTQSILGSAYFSWFFWDGRKDSQWSQALSPLEHADEHGGDRAQYVHLLQDNYHDEYEALFACCRSRENVRADAGPCWRRGCTRVVWDKLTNQEQQEISRTYANMGKAIAAYERQLLPRRLAL